MRREVPGPINETVRPRVRETALVMWAIYVGISVVLTIIFLLEGLSLFDAFCHSFGTMATGGFSTYNDSIGHFNSPLIEGTIIVFMIAAGTNFSLYYLILHHHKLSDSKGVLNRLSPLFRDPEYRVYLCFLLTATLVLTFSLQWNRNFEGNLLQSFRHAAFTSVSIMTTTGYVTEDFHDWSEFAKGLLLLLMFVGGCAGSTGGGLKVVRFLLFQKIIRLEIEQAFRPNVVRPLRIFGRPVESELRHEVIVYFSLVLFLFISSWMILAAIEPDAQWESKPDSQSAVTTTEVDPASKPETDHKAEKLLDCASAVAATLNNIGPGLGVLGPHSDYSGFSQPGKMLLALLMLLGRLELFAILVLFVPAFWRV